MSAQFSVRVPDDLLERVRILAEKNGTSVPILIRDILEKYAANELSMDERVRRLEKAVESLEKEVRRK